MPRTNGRQTTHIFRLNELGWIGKKSLPIGLNLNQILRINSWAREILGAMSNPHDISLKQAFVLLSLHSLVVRTNLMFDLHLEITTLPDFPLVISICCSHKGYTDQLGGGSFISAANNARYQIPLNNYKTKSKSALYGPGWLFIIHPIGVARDIKWRGELRVKRKPLAIRGHIL